MRARRRLQHPGRESRHRRVGGELITRLLSRYDKKGGFRLARLWAEWERVVGAEVAELARPLGHREGALLLSAPDSMAAQQLSYYAPELLERVNAFFGEEVFDKIRFELLDGRVPLAGKNAQEPPQPRPAPVMPKDVGSLLGIMDPETAIGRCYRAYVRRMEAARDAAHDANTRPHRASRRAT